MQIDWFTVAAEIVNFLILVFLLWKFLYQRIVNIAEEREEKIASRYAEVEEHEQEAKEEAETYRRRRQELEEEREALLAEVREEAEEHRHELIREARSAVEEQQEEWSKAMVREQRRFLRRLHQRAGEQVYAVARRALADLADADLEEQVVDVFIDRLHQLDDDKRQSIINSLRDSNAELRTAFPLPENRRQEIVDVLRKQLSEDLSPQFNIDEDLVCGVALRVDGRQVTWNIDSYLDRLEQQVQETLDETLRRELEELEREKEEADKQSPEDTSELDEKIEEKVKAVLAEEATDSTGEADKVEENG